MHIRSTSGASLNLCTNERPGLPPSAHQDFIIVPAFCAAAVKVSDCVCVCECVGVKTTRQALRTLYANEWGGEVQGGGRKERTKLTLFGRVPPPPTTAPWVKAAREKQKVSGEASAFADGSTCLPPLPPFIPNSSPRTPVLDAEQHMPS